MPTSTTPDLPTLTQRLRHAGIPLEQWGTGEAKTVEHLLSELTEGECVLIDDPAGLIRIAYGACLRIYGTVNDRTMVLIEEGQRFRDGRFRQRDLNFSVGEKNKFGEPAQDAAYRALAEELGITAAVDLGEPFHQQKDASSQSYPGLRSIYEMAVFTVCLPAALVDPDGYVEEQTDKQTFWRWAPVADVPWA
jgi:8-oxo-dGTP pyrophosphatase MutT (NUDIX family)